MAMSAHFFTSLHPCFKESGTCDGVGKQGLVRHSQSPLRPVFESHDSQYIDRKTRRSPFRWSHSLTLPRAPRTVRTAFYMMACRSIYTGVSSIPYVRVPLSMRIEGPLLAIMTHTRSWPSRVISSFINFFGP